MPNFRIYNSDNKNFPVAANEHRITITFKDESFLTTTLGKNNTYGTVIGYLNKEFEYSAKGNYSDVFGVTTIDSLIAKVAEDTLNRNIIPNYGYLTKKMFTHGESPSLSLDFRCWAGDSENGVNYQGSKINSNNQRTNDSIKSNPVLVANLLVNATLPRVSNDAALLTKDAPKALGQVAKKGATLGLNVAQLAGTGFLQMGAAVVGDDNDIKTLDTLASENITNIANNLDSWFSKKPPVCEVKVGNIFHKDMMVVTSVDVKFSKEYTASGVPLYGDFSVNLQSLFSGSVLGDMTNLNSNLERTFGSGFNGKSSTRVTFDDEKITEQDIGNAITKFKSDLSSAPTDNSRWQERWARCRGPKLCPPARSRRY
jgi:hypothetical protein